MKTDRELLEAAAKAAGVDGECRTENLCHDGDWGDMTVIFLADDEGWWGPLHDDGDALRLAVKLGMSMDTALGQSLAIALGGGECVERHADDPYAATRRAIVCAAAAMVTSLL